MLLSDVQKNYLQSRGYLVTLGTDESGDATDLIRRDDDGGFLRAGQIADLLDAAAEAERGSAQVVALFGGDPSKPLFGTAGRVAEGIDFQYGGVNPVVVGGLPYVQIHEASDLISLNDVVPGARAQIIYDDNFGYLLPLSVWKSPQMQAHLAGIIADNARGDFVDRAAPIAIAIGLAIAGAGIYSGLTAAAGAASSLPVAGVHAADLSLADASAALTGPAPGSFAGPQLFGAEDLAYQAGQVWTQAAAIPADAAAALTGPAAGTFAGPQLFGPEHLMQDAIRAVYEIPFPTVTPAFAPPALSVPGPSLPSLPSVTDALQLTGTAAKALAGVAGAATALKQLENANAAGSVQPGGAFNLGPVPASVQLGGVGLVLFALVVIAGGVYLARKIK